MPDSHVEAERLRYFILAAQRHGGRQMNEYMKTIDLTASQSEVIRILEQWQPISLKELGSLLICEAGSPSRLIDRMAEGRIPDGGWLRRSMPYPGLPAGIRMIGYD
jgi:DNA-binding MarR family transcriptional regulator